MDIWQVWVLYQVGFGCKVEFGSVEGKNWDGIRQVLDGHTIDFGLV